jgi:6-pyruvoyltetrahydropterin/6-carboxytetrahydropterin synthase
MSANFHVRIANDRLVFCAAHFITIGNDVCERLHGHNYRVAVEVTGPLDKNQFVIDFIALRDALDRILLALDHCVLLPTENPLIHLTADEQTVEAKFADRRWVLPRGDCVLLPLPNTTAEKLAEYIGGRLLEELRCLPGDPPQKLTIEVEESCGMIGVCELSCE